MKRHKLNSKVSNRKRGWFKQQKRGSWSKRPSKGHHTG